MKIYDKNALDDYMKNDYILKELNRLEEENDRHFRTQSWMKEIAAKRMIYCDMYGDLLSSNSRKKVLDVGGGYTSLTRALASNNEYWLLDFMAHGEHQRLRNIEKEVNTFWINEDWYEFTIKRSYDIVLANDIFPDVDQRMELFLDKFLPFCKEIRLCLTYYNDPKFYLTKRLDDTELLTFLSWDGEITALKLSKYINRIAGVEKDQIFGSFTSSKESIYRNGRQVAYVVIQGDVV